MSDLDILADLQAAPKRPKGNACRIAEMRRDRPDLVVQWERVLTVTQHPAVAIADWFTDHDFPLTRGVIERHRRNPPCGWCVPGREIVA